MVQRLIQTLIRIKISSISISKYHTSPTNKVRYPRQTVSTLSPGKHVVTTTKVRWKFRVMWSSTDQQVKVSESHFVYLTRTDRSRPVLYEFKHQYPLTAVRWTKSGSKGKEGNQQQDGGYIWINKNHLMGSQQLTPLGGGCFVQTT